jgi:hypothetical protein
LQVEVLGVQPKQGDERQKLSGNPAGGFGAAKADGICPTLAYVVTGTKLAAVVRACVPSPLISSVSTCADLCIQLKVLRSELPEV